ncbi:hypothetical protein STEG23_005360 [Scotinomys teguina]
MSFASEEPIECNGEFSYPRRTLLSSTTSYLWLNSVYAEWFKHSGLVRTKEPWILKTRGIFHSTQFKKHSELGRTRTWILQTDGYHSTPFKKVIRTVPPLTSNTLYYFGTTDRVSLYLCESIECNEDENLWIASRLIWFDQPRPPDSSQTAPVKIGPSS